MRPGDDSAFHGDPGHPAAVAGHPVVARLRVRRDVPGALVALADGRYAVTGPLVFVGGRDDLAAYARRRMRTADADERAWLQNVVGALAADFPPLTHSTPRRAPYQYDNPRPSSAPGTANRPSCRPGGLALEEPGTARPSPARTGRP